MQTLSASRFSTRWLPTPISLRRRRFLTSGPTSTPSRTTAFSGGAPSPTTPLYGSARPATPASGLRPRPPPPPASSAATACVFRSRVQRSCRAGRLAKNRSRPMEIIASTHPHKKTALPRTFSPRFSIHDVESQKLYFFSRIFLR